MAKNARPKFLVVRLCVANFVEFRLAEQRNKEKISEEQVQNQHRQQNTMRACDYNMMRGTFCDDYGYRHYDHKDTLRK